MSKVLVDYLDRYCRARIDILKQQEDYPKSRYADPKEDPELAMKQSRYWGEILALKGVLRQIEKARGKVR